MCAMLIPWGAKKSIYVVIELHDIVTKPAFYMCRVFLDLLECEIYHLPFFLPLLLLF